MFPIGDQNPTRTTPFVNYLLLILNVLAYLGQLFLTHRHGDAWMIPGYGIVPTRLVPDPGGEAFTLVTYMFLHGDWGHLGSNLLYLYIFGDNVEDAMGHFRYLLFYMIAGVAAGLVQVVASVGSPIPIVGASGAIAGTLGGYIVLYPRAPIAFLNPIPLLWFVFGLFVMLPAWLVIGFWFLGNLFGGITQLWMPNSGGLVAFFTHIGGFLAGMLLVRSMAVRRRERHTWAGLRPPSGRIT
jgi:membrane associated rhomboid family serine protease